MPRFETTFPWVFGRTGVFGDEVCTKKSRTKFRGESSRGYSNQVRLLLCTESVKGSDVGGSEIKGSDCERDRE